MLGETPRATSRQRTHRTRRMLIIDKSLRQHGEAMVVIGSVAKVFPYSLEDIGWSLCFSAVLILKLHALSSSVAAGNATANALNGFRPFREFVFLDRCKPEDHGLCRYDEDRVEAMSVCRRQKNLLACARSRVSSE